MRLNALAGARLHGRTPEHRPGSFYRLLGLGSLGGNLCVNQALRIAPASVVVPYQYTLILWGMLFGYLFFGEMIGPLTVTGAAIIIGAGLFIFMREQQLRRKAG